jgi:hypothetical protein
MLEWVRNTGYIHLWEETHRAEEALILTTRLERVVAGALNDEIRLQGSNIDNRDMLLAHLRDAVMVLIRQGSLYVRTHPAGTPLPNPPTPADVVMAREMLCQVRRAINEFRDEQRRGLVRAGNQLLSTIMLTQLVGLALLAFAVLVHAPVTNLIAAITFYLVGATVGLFNRLYLDANIETAIEDYGLARVRLWHTPLISGLAALGGVLIIPMLSVLVNSGTAQGLSPVLPHLGNIFNLDDRPFGLVLAAIFGLSPTVLISRLQQEAEKYKADLKSTESPARLSGR